MDQRLSLVTLGVADVARATAFYERLGWRRSSASVEGTTFFDLGGVVLSLWSREELARDAGIDAGGADAGRGGFSGIAVALNVADRSAVDAALAEAVAAGGRLARAAEATAWGGYSGYFADPDGHLWEIAHNPFWPLDAAGRVQLPA